MRISPLVLVLVAACTGGEPHRVDLLSRTPDELHFQGGQLVAAPGVGIGQAERAGFEPEPEGEPALVWTDRVRGSLFLDAVAPADRTLELELRSPNEKIEVRVLLNGVEVGALEVGAELATQALETPAQAWLRGANVLELEASLLHTNPAGASRGIGVRRVAWGEAVAGEVDPAARSARFDAGAGAAWALEGGFDTLTLELGGAGAAATLRLERMDPLFGGRTPLASHELGLAAGEDAGAFSFDLPSAGEGVLVAALEAKSPLILTAANASASDRPATPPIVFVSIDTFAARHASAYGYARETTPRLAAFADRAVSFTACRANAPFTLSSYLSQLTGLYPAAHAPAEDAGAAADAEDRGAAYSMQHLDARRWTLAEALRAAGYKTAAFVDNPWLDRDFGFRQGFDVYDASAARINQTDPTGGAAHVIPLAEAWLDGLAPDDVPFLFVQVIDLHYPYIAMPPWDEAFQGDNLWDPEHELPVAPTEDLSFDTIPNLVARGILRYGTVPASMRTAPIIDAYDQKVLELDERIGAFFDSLGARGLWEDAVVVVSADHGEAMLEHSYKFNHGLLYEEHLHVPLFIRLPKGERAGRVVTADVQLVDLFPTLLELAGLGDGRTYYHGRSLVDAMHGGELDPRPVFGEGGVQRQRSIEVEGWKLIESEPAHARFPFLASHPRVRPVWDTEIEPALRAAREAADKAGEPFDHRRTLGPLLQEVLAGTFRELYYLPDDPLELNDLAAEESERVEQLAALLAAEKQRGVDARMASAPGAGAIPEDLAAELRDLGYAVGD